MNVHLFREVAVKRYIQREKERERERGERKREKERERARKREKNKMERLSDLWLGWAALGGT